MSEIAELREPYESDFIQPSKDGQIGTRSTDIFVGKRVLEGFFHSDDSDLDEETKTKLDYSELLLECVVGDGLPFTTIHTTRETLNIAITSLGHGNNDRDGADECLKKVRESDVFKIHHCPSVDYDSVVAEFLEYDPREISIQEAVLASIAKSIGVTHIATWDSDFTRYSGELVLYPRNYWEL
jgi:predicted nucleic acid-binding protein